MLSEFQQKKFTHYFKLWDVDKSGSLTFEDFAQLLKRIAEMKSLTPDSVEYQALKTNTDNVWGGMQQFADTNNDGKVSLDEWLTYCDNALPMFKQMAETNAPTPMAQAIFTVMDVDGDGKVTPGEWGYFLKAWGISDEPAAHFKLMDLNRDGTMNNDDFIHLTYVWGFSDNADEPGNYVFGSF